MNDKEIKLPFYAKANIIIIGIFALFTMLYIAKGIIIPIIFALIIAIVLHPVVNLFVRFGINRIVGIVFTLFLTFLLIAGFGALIFSQASMFSESFPTLMDKFTQILNQSTTWISQYFDINPQNIHDWITRLKNEVINGGNMAIRQIIVSVGNVVVVLFLIPVYVFMILYYQPLLIEFIRRLFGLNNRTKVDEIITQTKTLIQQYIRGLFIEAIIVASLYSAGLLIIGIDYAILLGCIAALLNIIPYIGGIIAVSLIIIIALVTKDTVTYPILVWFLSVVIHIIDNSYIVPKIVASKVRINALVSIIVIIASGALFGVPGMIICIPVTGILKLIYDQYEPLKPWGFLLGDTMQPMLKLKPILKKIKKKFL